VSVLDDLDPEQRAAAEAVSGPVCIIAGAGTGKTRTVTHRIAHAVASGHVDARTVLAITHSRKAATEMAERLVQLGVAAVDSRTFHAAGLRVAGQFWSATGRQGASPTVISGQQEWRMWRDALRALSRADPDNAAVRDVMDEVGWARSRLVGPDRYPVAAAADRHPGIDADLVVTAWAGYDQAKSARAVVDFADLLEIAADLLTGDADVAARVRRRWSYVTVDEYQDTDPAQQRLLDAILGGAKEVCVVGDPRQAIYSWKGADPSYLRGFTRRYPTSQLFALTRNYRSTPQILEWANRIAVDQRGRRLVATRPSGPAPRITPCEDESSEAAWVVTRAIQAMAAGTPPAEIAILYRFNATQARFEAALAQADIAAVVAGDTTFFDRPEVTAALASFDQSARSRPDQPGVALFQSTMQRAGFDRDAPPAGQGAARARWESQQALLDLVESLPGAGDASSVWQQLERLAARTHGPRAAGVTLASLHRAKGLEWDVVFIVGAHDGAIPASYATTTEAKDEEERLFHVGVTRARRELFVTWSATSARGWVNRPSPYLDLLPSRRPTPTSSPRKRASGTSTAERGGRDRTGRDGGGRDSGGRNGAGRGRVSLPGGAASSADCPHCTEPLRGVSARRLGVCAHCVTRAPGPVGDRARAVVELVDQAARMLGRPADGLVSPAGLLHLLDRRPASVDEIGATAGVELPVDWAQKLADVLGD
jgi:DNA helicase-2/ATP-dependent DNA helicase PcrA